METLDDFVERCRRDVEKESDQPVYKKALKYNYNLHRHPMACLPVELHA